MAQGLQGLTSNPLEDSLLSGRPSLPVTPWIEALGFHQRVPSDLFLVQDRGGTSDTNLLDYPERIPRFIQAKMTAGFSNRSHQPLQRIFKSSQSMAATPLSETLVAFKNHLGAAPPASAYEREPQLRSGLDSRMHDIPAVPYKQRQVLTSKHRPEAAQAMNARNLEKGACLSRRPRVEIGNKRGAEKGQEIALAQFAGIVPVSLMERALNSWSII